MGEWKAHTRGAWVHWAFALPSLVYTTRPKLAAFVARPDTRYVRRALLVNAPIVRRVRKNVAAR